MRNILFSLVVALLVISCAAPVQKSTLSLNYASHEVQSKTNEVKLALIKPKYSKNQLNKQMVAINQSTPFGAIMNKRMEEITPVDYRINQKFTTDMSVTLENSMYSDIETIIKSKGFRVISSSINEDEITYSQKQNIDLIIVPEFDISPSVLTSKPLKCTPMPVVGQSCSEEEGTLSLSGKIYLNFIEPMSREKILIKSVDISSLSGSGIIRTTSYIGYHEAEEALVTMLNASYPELMTRVARVIDTDEIQSTMSDVTRLKEKNK